ncbi:MAG: multidrug transporter AcrB [Betaproteobacteria bacterium RIFCSPLOWO2_02_FULL_63_19]|nr:MAG: multidrug transporter AcrB [Betaproteobacteria bacterium RIFCSPLOWO2_02_FULL_63_19]
MSENLGISGRTSRFFVASQLTPLVALAAMLLGVFAVLVTPREEEPQINVTMANVLIPFPGASAKDVESLVATPAEQVLSQITGIEHVFTVSKPGIAVVTVQFKVGEDRTQALVRLYDTVYSNRDWVSPELGVGDFIIKPMGIDDVPIVTLTLWTSDPQRGAYDLERVAHAAEVELKRVPGTRVVQTLGGPGRSVRVLLDPVRMQSYGVTMQDVRGALLAANVSLPAGRLVAGNREITVETGNFLQSSEDVKRLVLGAGNRQGHPVYIEDVAQVIDGPELPGRYVWFGVGAAGGKHNAGQFAPATEFPAVTIAISKKAGENAVDVADHLLRRVEQLKGSVIPEGIEVTLTRNYGETANDKAMKLIQKLIFATLSVVALVWAALGRREAAIVGTAVILTLAATLFASWAWGFTLNRVSLFALIFSIGILVDDAIVVVENIHRHRALAPEGPLALMIPLAVDEVGGPTILATFTVIAALLPMAFVTGLMGPYMSPIPINASIGMLISLAVAFVVTPWLAARLLGKHHPAAAEAHGAAPGTATRMFGRVIGPFLRGADGARARRWLLVGILALIAGSIALAAVRLVVLKMLPFDNKSEFQVVVDMPTGTALEETSRVLHELGASLATVPEVTDYQAYAGTSAPINFNGLVRQYYLRASPELGDLQVNLVDQHHRERKSHDIALAVRPQLEAIGRKYGATVKVVEVPPGPPVLSPIVAEVYGPDYAGQLDLAQALRGLFSGTPDIVDVDSSVEEAAAKLVLRVDRRKATALGVTQADIVQTLRSALAGDNVTPLHSAGAKYEIPIKISLPPEQTGSAETLLGLRVRAQDGNLVPLSELVIAVQTQRDRSIYHKDLLPVAYVVGDMAGKLDSPLYGMFGMRGEIAKLPAPHGGALGEYFIRAPEDPYAGYAIKWDGEWQVTYETFRDMGIAYAVGLILIYLLVVAQFRSYTVPLVIMAPIPLTIIGVMPGHALLGAQFTATSMIGMIALAGIIVRNSILLVDFIDLEVSCGTDFQGAVVKAAATRAKPIVLTGLAAMLGAFFILDDPIFNGLAVSLIFGIFVSTLLTLVVIPVLYYALRWKRIAAGACDILDEAGVAN